MRITQHHETTVQLDQDESPVMTLVTTAGKVASVRVTKLRRLTQNGELYAYGWSGFKVRQDGKDGAYLTGHTSETGTTVIRFETQLPEDLLSLISESLNDVH